MKKTVFILSILSILSCSAPAQTNAPVIPANLSDQLGISGSAKLLMDSIGSSGIFYATNYALAEYLTYAPKAKNTIGGGLMAVYNAPSLNGDLGGIGMCLGADYLGGWSLVSGNLSLRVNTHPLNVALFSFLPASFTTNIVAQPYTIVGIGTPMSGGNQGAAEIWDVGYNVVFYKVPPTASWFSGWQIGAGACWGEWMNAGPQSGHRWHINLIEFSKNW